MTAWLIIERLENWEVDKATNFSRFGISQRYFGVASKISEGDLIFCYVSSSISAFSDIRRVLSGGIKPLRGVTDYDSAYDFYFSTAPVLVLSRDRWPRLKTLLDSLDLTKGRAAWGVMFRTSLRQLTDHDAGVLQATLAAAKDQP